MSREASRLYQYEKVRSQMKTGDVIAFSGTTGFSDFIKLATRSPYSHVGIVLKADFGGGFGESILMVESTTETSIRDYNKKEAIKGVQIHWLSKRIEMYQGSVWWVPLQKPLEIEGQHEMEAWLRQTYNHRVPYDFVQIYGAGIDIFDRYGLENDPDFSTLFCSELVAKALQVGGAVDEKVNPSELTPRDIVYLPCLQQPPIALKIDPSMRNVKVNRT